MCTYLLAHNNGHFHALQIFLMHNHNREQDHTSQLLDCLEQTTFEHRMVLQIEPQAAGNSSLLGKKPCGADRPGRIVHDTSGNELWQGRCGGDRTEAKQQKVVAPD